jgi:hypothetical protein
MIAMSDVLQFIVDEAASRNDATGRASAIRAILVREGIVEPAANGDCVLAGEGHPPGPSIAALYTAAAGEVDFTKLVTNGVTIECERFANLTYPYPVETVVCPRCEATVDRELLFEAVEVWLDGDDAATVSCKCGQPRHLREWKSRNPSEPPIVCGNLVVTFYNWPALDSKGWKKDIRALVGEALAARPSVAWTQL